MDIAIQIKTEHITLAGALKLAGVVGSGGEAKHLIQCGMVRLRDKTDTRRGAKVRPGDTILVEVDPSIRITVAAL
jgi:ribosome-associated protein